MSADYKPFRDLPDGSGILVGFSGGVDSSVTAILAKEAGYRVTAVRMVLFPEDNPEAATRADATAELLGIPLHTVSLAEDFRTSVLRPCWEQFKSGITPNPCAMCNPRIKFGKLLPYLKQFGCEAFATGHYAKICSADSGPVLARASFRPKDQSYFLSCLSREQLRQIVFPLGDMTKDEVRTIARSYHLPCAEAKESQDACFMPPNQTAAGFLKELFAEETEPGIFRAFSDGRLLGSHSGIWNYTIGQRKGTGVAMGVPAWINRIEQRSQTVWLTTEESDLFANRLATAPVHWILPPDSVEFQAQVQIRYRSQPVDASVKLADGNRAIVTFASPVRAVTPGQIAVFYRGDVVLGGAQILGAS